MVAAALLAGAVIGLLSSAVYLVLATIAAIRFRRERFAPAGHRMDDGILSPVSILKPVHGPEPRLAECLESFFRQDYPTFELVFGARTNDDEALTVVQTLRHQYPHVRCRVVVTGEPTYPNAKVSALEQMIRAASYEHLV